MNFLNTRKGFSLVVIVGLFVMLTAGWWVRVADLPGYSLCLFKNLFQTDCPGCGLTRSFVAIGRGQLMQAWKFHPGGLFLYAFFLSLLMTEAYKVLAGKTDEVPFYYRKITPWLASGLAIFFLLSWLYRLM